ncbi:MAG: FmdB family zinc ribbon protein [Acidimicrobiales bacterium]|nr:FmdB family zinc ribbon protein [Acidimicrobiales bacterium]
MPTYQYKCKECGHEFETVQSFHDDALTTCPECSGALKKVYGNVGIAFKGSGFYKNDSRSKSKSSASSPDDSSSSSDSSSASTSSDAKSDSKSDSKSSASTSSSSD